MVIHRNNEIFKIKLKNNFIGRREDIALEIKNNNDIDTFFIGFMSKDKLKNKSIENLIECESGILCFINNNKEFIITKKEFLELLSDNVEIMQPLFLGEYDYSQDKKIFRSRFFYKNNNVVVETEKIS